MVNSLNYPSLLVTRAEWGDSWPLTVDYGVLQLRANNRLTFVTGGQVYAVNGLAKAEKGLFGRHRYRFIDEIWANDLAHPGLKKNIGGLIRAGLALGTKP